MNISKCGHFGLLFSDFLCYPFRKLHSPSLKVHFGAIIHISVEKVTSLCLCAIVRESVTWTQNSVPRTFLIILVCPQELHNHMKPNMFVRCFYISPQHGSFVLVVSSSGALSFSRGGSPLAWVKYTALGDTSRCTDSGDSNGPWGPSGGSADRGIGGAGCFCSLAAALWRLRSASVW